MTQTHTPEPWIAGFSTRAGTVIDPSDPTDNLGKNIGIVLNKTDARRIVAAVNACAGIETEELESAGAGFWGRFASRNGKQRDNLLIAISSAIESLTESDGGYAVGESNIKDAVFALKNALAFSSATKELFTALTEPEQIDFGILDTLGKFRSATNGLPDETHLNFSNQPAQPLFLKGNILYYQEVLPVQNLSIGTPTGIEDIDAVPEVVDLYYVPWDELHSSIQFQAYDRDGRLFAYEEHPILSLKSEQWMPDGEYQGGIGLKKSKVPIPNWQQTLIERPTEQDGPTEQDPSDLAHDHNAITYGADAPSEYDPS